MHQQPGSTSLPRSFAYTRDGRRVEPHTPENSQIVNVVPNSPHRRISDSIDPFYVEMLSFMHHPQPQRVTSTVRISDSANLGASSGANQAGGFMTPNVPHTRTLAPAPNLRGNPWVNNTYAQSIGNSTDSSASSFGSSIHGSLGDSSTSIDDSDDPFIDTPSKVPVVPVVTARRRRRPRARSPRSPRFLDDEFTQEMDQHIMNTYTNYVQDPRYTPFKTAPGSAPPIGVIHRVAREAMRTWSKVRRSTTTISRRSTIGDSPQTPCNDNADEMFESVMMSTPQGALAPISGHRAWRPSERVTQKRVHDLLKQKLSISTHFQRMLRSPLSSMRRGVDSQQCNTSQTSTPKNHTWSPPSRSSRVRAATVITARPSTPVNQIIDFDHDVDGTSEPVRAERTGVSLKRRARNQLEYELSPGGSNLPDVVLAGSRRVRGRGFSVDNIDRVRQSSATFRKAISTPKASEDVIMTPADSSVGDYIDGPKRLGSPFKVNGDNSIHAGLQHRRVASDTFMTYQDMPENNTSINLRTPGTFVSSTIRRHNGFQLPSDMIPSSSPIAPSIDEILENSFNGVVRNNPFGHVARR